MLTPRVARTAAWLACGGVGAMLVLEALLRIVPVPAVEMHRRAQARAESPRFFEHDADLGWRGRAGARGSLLGWEFTSDVRLNGRGFRDADVGNKPAGVFRVVLLGDSITWGHGVGQAERYGDLVAAALRGRGVAVEVVNLAVSGYGTDQELLLWEAEGARHCADLVLLGLYDNDVWENASAVQGRHPKPYFERSNDGALTRRNAPVPRVADTPPAPPAGGPRAWLRRHARVWAALAFVREAIRRPDAAATTPPEVPEHGLELTAALVKRLAASVRGDGAAFAVLVLPDVHDAQAPREAARRSGVAPVVDLAPPFRRAAAARAPLFYTLDGAHWTARGHAVAADALTRWIVDTAALAGAPRACAERR